MGSDEIEHIQRTTGTRRKKVVTSCCAACGRYALDLGPMRDPIWDWLDWSFKKWENVNNTALFQGQESTDHVQTMVGNLP